MNIYYDPRHNTDVTIKMSYDQMIALRYMLTLAYTDLQDDLAVENMSYHGTTSPATRYRLDINLELRNQISDIIDKHNEFMVEQEKKYE